MEPWRPRARTSSRPQQAAIAPSSEGTATRADALPRNGRPVLRAAGVRTTGSTQSYRTTRWDTGMVQWPHGHHYHRRRYHRQRQPTKCNSTMVRPGGDRVNLTPPPPPKHFKTRRSQGQTSRGVLLGPLISRIFWITPEARLLLKTPRAPLQTPWTWNWSHCNGSARVKPEGRHAPQRHRLPTTHQAIE